MSLPLTVLKAPKFLADAMSGKLARKLRVFGFDTLYVADVHDNEILKIGIADGRIIITADKELFKRVARTGAQGVLISGKNDLEDLVHILAKNGISSVDLAGIGSRCSKCNGLLQEKKPEQVKQVLPGKIAELYDEFYQCDSCGKVYWEGGHLTRIRALAKSVDTKLALAT